MKTLDAEIDRLFQLPLADFTVARNALAKGAGTGGAAIKQLAKPPVAAWAVNQLYWTRRAEYAALIDAALEMRRTHKAVIEGKRGDLRAAGREHERTLEAALKATLGVMKDAGQPATDATRHAVLNTLRALPGEDEPGRLTRALMPGGFEMLSGLKPAKRRKDSTVAKAPAPQTSDREAAARALRDAEHQARRAEFDAARTARDAARADRRMEDAREGLDQAQNELDAAQSSAADAERAREAAERASRDANRLLEAARAKVRRR